MDHLEKLHGETCRNHPFPIKQKLRDYNMMKNFMASRSLPRGMELDEAPNEGGATPFPREDEVMTIYDGHPLPGVHHMSNQSLGTLARYGWGCRDAQMKGLKFSNIFVNNVCRNMDMYITDTPKSKKNGRKDSLESWGR
jgi:hypothetical protein